jgi:hypothetical protein
MAEDDADDPMTADEMISAAEELLEKLRSGWRERGFPPTLLAHAMIGAGITDLTDERGADAALQLLREIAAEIEEAKRGRPN